MKICYFLDHENFRAMADVSVASARSVMPGAEIVHVTNREFPALAGAHSVVRAYMDGNFMRRWSAMRDQIEGDVLYADADTIFRRSVEHVFTLPFDIALPHIADPTVRFDGGIVFSRAPRFWQQLRAMPAYTCGHDNTPVAQIVREFNEVADDFSGTLHVLPGAIYSYVPRNENDVGSDAAIVHYRGPRKRWMPKGTK